MAENKTPLQKLQDEASAQLEIARIDAAEASRRRMARRRLDDPNYRARGDQESARL